MINPQIMPDSPRPGIPLGSSGSGSHPPQPTVNPPGVRFDESLWAIQHRASRMTPARRGHDTGTHEVRDSSSRVDERAEAQREPRRSHGASRAAQHDGRRSGASPQPRDDADADGKAQVSRSNREADTASTRHADDGDAKQDADASSKSSPSESSRSESTEKTAEPDQARRDAAQADGADVDEDKGPAKESESQTLAGLAMVKVLNETKAPAAEGRAEGSSFIGRIRGQMQGVAQQLQQALNGAANDAGAQSTLAAGSTKIFTSNGGGQSGTGQQGQQSQPSQSGQASTLAQLLSQMTGQASAPTGDQATTATSFASAMAASATNSGGSATAATVLEGLQQNSSGEGASNGTRPGAAPTNGTQTQTSASDLNAGRLARGLQSAVQQRGGSVTLRLTPPEMGTVRIQLQIQGNSVNAQFHAQTESARQMLTQQLSQLRQALEGQGLSVDRLSAQTMPPSSSQTNFHQAQHGQTAQQQADASPDDGRSRGEYGGNASNDEQHDADDGDAQANEFEKVLNEVG